jgi:hypothetical protein
MKRALINRNLIVLLPKQPALDWILRVDPEPMTHLTLDAFRQEQDAFLVPEGKVETPEAAQRWAERRWDAIFTQFLFSWFVDESMWPERRTLGMFRQWFEVQYHSMVWDVSGDPIVHDDWEEA